MTEAAYINRLKLSAKRYARANRVALHEAFDFIAANLGYASWTKVVSANKSGWIPSSDQVVNRPGFAGGSNFQIGWSHDEQNDEQVFP